MSVQSMSWALREQVGDSTRKLVLIGLADHSHQDGTIAFPSVATLAGYAECSPRTVQRHLVALEGAGFIAKGDQGFVAELRADRRPTVWNLLLERGDNLTPRRSERGDTQRVNGVTPSAPRGDIAVSPEPYRTVQEPSTGAQAFEQFWSIYPRKVAKGQALRAFQSAAKRAETAEIVKGAERYAREQRGKDEKYIAHAATWLNGDRWLDESVRSSGAQVTYTDAFDVEYR